MPRWPGVVSSVREEINYFTNQIRDGDEASVDTSHGDAPTDPICQVQPQKGDKFKFNLFLLVVEF